MNANQQELLNKWITLYDVRGEDFIAIAKEYILKGMTYSEMNECADSFTHYVHANGIEETPITYQELFNNFVESVSGQGPPAYFLFNFDTYYWRECKQVCRVSPQITQSLF